MRPALRHAATAVAGIALVLLAVRPGRTVTTRPGDALLVTPGASAARVRRLADSLGTMRVLALTGADSLPDAGYVARHFGAARRLHVVGWGLPDVEWRTLGSAPASFHPAPPPPGFTAAAWPRTLALGDAFRVHGSLRGRPQARIYLGDRSGPLDSTTAGVDGAFELGTRPRAAGRQSYALWSAGVAAETVGVVVTPPPRWRTLILTAAPSFEAAALRDLLAARGSPVTWRAGISRERTRTEVVNRTAAQLDLVILDGRSLLALSARERAALLRAVADSGLGVLLLPDQSLESAATGLGFALAADTALTERLVRPRTADARPAATPVPAESYRLGETFAVRTVLWGAAGEILAQVSPRGAGRVAVTLVTAPSRWIRAGEHAAFAAYWAPLLAATAGRQLDDPWTVGGWAPERVQQPVAIALRAAQGSPIALVVGPTGDRDTVYLAADAVEPGRWLGRFWPRDAGWHEITGAPGGGAGFYVTRAAAWPGVQAVERLDATARWAAAAPAAGVEQASQTRRRPYPLGWWLGLFVIAAGVLWADRRRAYIRAMPRTAVAVLLVALWACSKSPEKRRSEVERCSAVTSDAQLIAVCLMTEHKWKDAEADSAGRVKAHEIDSSRTAQEDSMWSLDAARHTAALKQCSTGNDVKECLLVRFGWSDARATRAADSLWNRAADRHRREVQSCARGRNPIASCLMLNYKWNARRAMATEDSVRRARMR